MAYGANGQTYEIVFDGGSLGNPGEGYGSYVIEGPDGYRAHEQLSFGNGVTNNQAEYMTLIAALAHLREEHLGTARQLRLVIRGDSQLVLNQLSGRYKVRNPGLAPLHREAGLLLETFGGYELVWQPREKSVRVLGH